MVTEVTGVKILDPTVAPMPTHADMALRPESLDGKILGLLANGKGKRSAINLLDHVATLIAEHYQIKEVVAREKGATSRPCPDDLIQELLDRCDVVVTATGD